MFKSVEDLNIPKVFSDLATKVAYKEGYNAALKDILQSHTVELQNEFERDFYEWKDNGQTCKRCGVDKKSARRGIKCFVYDKLFGNHLWR